MALASATSNLSPPRGVGIIEPAVMTVDEVCAYLRFSRPTFYRRLKAGCFESYLDGGRRKVMRRSVDAHLEKMLAAEKKRVEAKKLKELEGKTQTTKGLPHG